MSEITEGDTYLKEIQKRGILPALGTEYGGGDCIEQSPNELAEFCEWLKPLGIESYLEVGVSSGGLFKFMVEVMGYRGYWIDLNHPAFLPNAKYKGHWGNSHSVECINWANEHGPFDLVFIDASHKYEDIEKDTEAFGHLATKALAYHDIAGLRDCEGASEHWRKMSASNLDAFQIVDRQCSIGIGVLPL